MSVKAREALWAPSLLVEAALLIIILSANVWRSTRLLPDRAGPGSVDLDQRQSSAMGQDDRNPMVRPVTRRSWFDNLLPYTWVAKGSQARLSAIAEALAALPPRSGSTLLLRVQSRFEDGHVVVRISEPKRGGRLITKGRFVARSHSKAPDWHPKNVYSVLAAGFFTDASPTLSDADPRWNDFFLRSDSLRKGWYNVSISSQLGTRRFYLERLVLLDPSKKIGVRVPSHSFQ